MLVPGCLDARIGTLALLSHLDVFAVGVIAAFHGEVYSQWEIADNEVLTNKKCTVSPHLGHQIYDLLLLG